MTASGNCPSNYSEVLNNSCNFDCFAFIAPSCSGSLLACRQRRPASNWQYWPRQLFLRQLEVQDSCSHCESPVQSAIDYSDCQDNCSAPRRMAGLGHAYAGGDAKAYWRSFRGLQRAPRRYSDGSSLGSAAMASRAPVQTLPAWCTSPSTTCPHSCSGTCYSSHCRPRRLPQTTFRDCWPLFNFTYSADSECRQTNAHYCSSCHSSADSTYCH